LASLEPTTGNDITDEHFVGSKRLDYQLQPLLTTFDE